MNNKCAILSTLAYFDLFQYPLTERELYYFLSRTLSPREFEHALGELVLEGHIYTWEGLYTVRNEPALIPRRRQGNAMAADMLRVAEKVAAFLARFPFVRGVGVSGSLSKQYADEKSDIDFFIITAPNRLWIARTFLHVLKKLSFLIHREDWFCMNYFVDEAALEIPEKNLYTAVEIVTLLPMRGTHAFTAFGTANGWTDQWLPNSHGRFVLSQDEPPSWSKRVLEGMWNNALGDWLDRWLMRLTASRWGQKRIRGRLNNRGVPMSLDATRHSARPDPTGFQRGLLDAYEKRVAQLTQSFLRKEMI